MQTGSRFNLADMRHRWSGVRYASMTWLLAAINLACTGTRDTADETDSKTNLFPAMRDRVRRHGQLTSTLNSSCWTSRCTSPGFGNVSGHEMKRRYRLATAKEEILRKLRFNTPPNITGRVPGVPGMQNLMNQFTDAVLNSTYSGTDSMDTDHISPMTFILLSQPVPAERRSGLPSSCYFTLSPDLSGDQVITAQLGIYIHERNDVSSVPHRAGSAPATWILVYRISRSSSGRFEKTLQRRRKIYLNPQHTGRWQFFDARTFVESWIIHPEQNYGIQIIASDMQGDPLATLPTANASEDVLRPYIEIQVLSQTSNRQRRSPEFDCVEASAVSRCCRYPLTIDFESFGWDWVIAPRRYEAYYCSGECPFLFSQRQTHTYVTSQQVGVLGVPCCSPTVMAPLQMLYIDNNTNFVFGTLPGMIVQRCGCS